MPIITPDPVDIETDTDLDTPCGPSRRLRFSDSGGLTQFGAFVGVLPPRSRSSLCHWHQNEAEFIYMLTDEVTVQEGGGQHIAVARTNGLFQGRGWRQGIICKTGARPGPALWWSAAGCQLKW